MKILFICGALEFGRDGVGDYTRSLAGELIKEGFDIKLIALNDHHIECNKTEFQDVNSQTIETLRLASTESWKTRMLVAQSFVEEFNPAWLSLQFVPFAFQNRGIPWGMGPRLKRLGKGRKWHLMVHELWVGKKSPLDVRGQFRSTLQKALMKKMIRLINPSVIHTHLPLFKTQVEKFGRDVLPLALFSNISVSEKKCHEEKGRIKIGFFSQVAISESIITFLKKLVIDVKKDNLNVEIVFIGGNKENIEAKTAELKRNEIFKDNISYTGFLSPNDISTVLNSCSLGITPVPRHALGKSGSVAAFLTHGVPVAAPNVHKGYKFKEIGFFSPKLSEAILDEPDYKKIKRTAVLTENAKEEIMIFNIAQKFIQDLLA